MHEDNCDCCEIRLPAYCVHMTQATWNGAVLADSDATVVVEGRGAKKSSQVCTSVPALPSTTMTVRLATSR